MLAACLAKVNCLYTGTIFQVIYKYIQGQNINLRGMTEHIKCHTRDVRPLCCSSHERALTLQADIIFSSKPAMDKISLVLLLKRSTQFYYIMLSKGCLGPHLVTISLAIGLIIHSTTFYCIFPKLSWCTSSATSSYKDIITVLYRMKTVEI